MRLAFFSGGNMQQLIDSVFSLSANIRYVAVYREGVLKTAVSPNITAASDSDSDKYEELIVNPTILTLVKRPFSFDRGDNSNSVCGG